MPVIAKAKTKVVTKTTTKKTRTTKNSIQASNFHACIKAKNQWKKRSPDARAVYEMIVSKGIELYEWQLFHPKMTFESLPPKHFETIIHNIWRLTADEVTLQQKEWNKNHPENPVTKKVLS